MAKYEINYCCGHGSVTKQLFGKTSERERRIAWMEANMLCPACYKAEQEKKNRGMGLVLNVGIVNFPGPSVLFAFAGDTMPHKDAIKVLGYTWGDLPAEGVMGWLSTERPGKGWYKLVAADDNDGIKATFAAAAPLQPKINSKLDEVSVMVAARQIADKKAAEAKAAEAKEAQDVAIAALVRPSRPAWLAGEWNGKVYGTTKAGYRVYLDNLEVYITDGQEREVHDYLTAFADWKTKKAAILAGGAS